MREVATSADGVPIHYEGHGQGTPTLVFVHGWCCDRSYWKRQVEHFASQYAVVAIDLAGHGESGIDRSAWTIPAFSQDVVAVIEQLNLSQVVLVGHAYSGAVVVEAARQIAERVIGIATVDAFTTFGPPRTDEEMEMILAPFRTNFVETMRAFVHTMFVPASDPALVANIVEDMAASLPRVAIGAGEGQHQYGVQWQAALQAIQIPMIAINGDYHPTDVDLARHYGMSVELISDVGHFGMLEDPEMFNHLLEQFVQKVVTETMN